MVTVPNTTQRPSASNIPGNIPSETEYLKHAKKGGGHKGLLFWLLTQQEETVSGLCTYSVMEIIEIYNLFWTVVFKRNNIIDDY